MTVTAVLLNFRTALLALIPTVEKVGIAWKRPDAYDEWDAIASTLFEKLVVEVFRWALQEHSQEDFQLPSYDFLLPSYAGLATLEVAHPSLQHGRWVFHAFGTADEPFDVVEVRLLAEDGTPQLQELDACPVDGAAFRLQVGSQAHPIEEVEMADD